MHDPSALFRFQEHDVYIPMVVLEELDGGKRGMSEASRNARQASRFLDDLVKSIGNQPIEQGITINPLGLSGNLHGHAKGVSPTGKLFFQIQQHNVALPVGLPGGKNDNNILATALAARDTRPEYDVTLVSKDINLRLKARVIGINAEDYFSDQALDDVSLLPTGMAQLPDDFWDTHSKDMESWQQEGRTFYRLTGPLVEHWQLSQCIYLGDGSEFQAIVRSINDDQAVVELAHNYMNPKHSVWGITARNLGQNFALNLLMDPDIDFVTLLGIAGTGKTLLALAAGLTQTLESKRFKEIIMTRVTVPVGEDIGFLPGTEEEKMTPWMGALMDNLEVLTSPQGNSQWERQATNDLIASRIKIRSLNFMRGRTFQSKYIIIDEAQNLTAKQMKTLITRCGPGSKIVCLGNVQQIDTPYLTETTSGLTYVVDRFKGWPYSGHITLLRGERSRLADHASEVL
ncbi:MAG: PhoH family protein [Gammaproteobacteria bacterium]|nr:PhoH family protein [Gammaproteobacteria bacterium]